MLLMFIAPENDRCIWTQPTTVKSMCIIIIIIIIITSQNRAPLDYGLTAWPHACSPPM